MNDSLKKIPAVIIAGGKSTRTYPLTVLRPKTLLKVANREILAHSIEAVRDFASELIVIVGYQKEMIISFLKKEYPNLPIKYVEQSEQLGTGHALTLARNILPERFIVMMSDDLYSKEDIEKCLLHKYSILAKEVSNPECFGIIAEENGIMKGIVEKPKEPVSNLANCALYVLSKKIFEYNIEKSSRGEYELTDMVVALSRAEPINVEKAKFWMPITYSWSLLDANEELLKNIKGKIEGTVEPNATLKGEVVVGKGTIVKNGAYIEGPVVIGENCRIGPNCFIRASTSIGNNCHVGNGVELKNSILFDDTNVAHLSYVGDSVIGFNSNFGAGTIVANLRHDNSNIKSMVNGILVDTGRRKLGTIVGDNVHTGINTSIYPGRKIFSGKSTVPGQIVKEDIR